MIRGLEPSSNPQDALLSVMMPSATRRGDPGILTLEGGRG